MLDSIPIRWRLALISASLTFVILLGFAIAWFVSPIDLVPEFIPVFGPLDDAVVAALVLRHVLRKAGRDVIAEHWSGDEATLGVLLRVAGVREAAHGGLR